MSILVPKVDVPEGVSGAWCVERFEIDEHGAAMHNLRCSLAPGMGRRTVKAGWYTKLVRGREIIMSDTDAELRDHYEPVLMARDTILINGLGLGVVLNACMLKSEVKRAIVIEKSPDVVALCAKHYRAKFGDRVEIMQADAYEYRPPKGLRFGACWHDIWNALCGDNLAGMARLHRRYGRLTDWQGSWGKELCQDLARRSW